MFFIGFLVGFFVFYALYKIVERHYQKNFYEVHYNAKEDEYYLSDPDGGIWGNSVIFSSKNIEDVYERHRMIIEKKSILPITLTKNKPKKRKSDGYKWRKHKCYD